MKKDKIVRTYDYYTEEQWKRMYREEIRRDKAKQRKQHVNNIMTCIMLTIFMIYAPLTMFIWWLVFGY